MTAVLELRDVSKSFARRAGAQAALAAVRDVSMQIAAAEIVGLVGESGAGKSTLGRIALGLEQPEAGHVVFDGVHLAGLPSRELRRQRQRMHLIFQDPYDSLHPGMRIAEIVAEPLRIAGLPPAARVAPVSEALLEVDLTPPTRYLRRFPHELSGGQRQRVALARALIGQPRLVVADEPTSMLDVSLRVGILDLIARMRTRHGVAFLFITHDLAVARYVSDRIGVMRAGQLIALGPAEQIIAQPQHAYIRQLIAASQGIPPEAAALEHIKED
jgi:peptide/nickel transport system ATP-binding protein